MRWSPKAFFEAENPKCGICSHSSETTCIMQPTDMYTLNVIARLLRTNQWMKNAVIFVSIIFSGKLFEVGPFLASLTACIVFCFLSSGLYIVNDMLDAPSDRRHPVKKTRPIASGEVSVRAALIAAIALFVGALTTAVYFSPAFFLLCLLFICLNVAYSTILKSYAVIDIFAISFSFMVRAYAGEVVTGFHIPVWLRLTIFFLSLFIASIKRNAELTVMGAEARDTLAKYNKHFLDFLTYTFATATIIAYCLYSYIEQTPQVSTAVNTFVASIIPGIENRKLMTATIPVVVYAIARYGQLFYTRVQGERPETLIVTDVPLAGTMIIWAIMTVSIIYLL